MTNCFANNIEVISTYFKWQFGIDLPDNIKTTDPVFDENREDYDCWEYEDWDCSKSGCRLLQGDIWEAGPFRNKIAFQKYWEPFVNFENFEEYPLGYFYLGLRVTSHSEYFVYMDIQQNRKIYFRFEVWSMLNRPRNDGNQLEYGAIFQKFYALEHAYNSKIKSFSIIYDNPKHITKISLELKNGKEIHVDQTKEIDFDELSELVESKLISI